MLEIQVFIQKVNVQQNHIALEDTQGGSTQVLFKKK